MLPVATAIQHDARFKVTASYCDLPQRQYLDLFNENGGVFSFSSAVDDMSPFAFVGVLIILERRNKQSFKVLQKVATQGKENAL